MFRVTEGVERRTSYVGIALSTAFFTILLIIQVQLPDDSLAIGKIILDKSTIRGIAVQLQMFISIYLVLRENKPGYITSVLLNSVGLLRSIAYLIISDSLVSLPGLISFSGVLVTVTLIKAYKDRIFEYNKIINTQAKRESIFSSVFNQAPIGIAIVRDKTYFRKNELEDISINPRYEQILGIDKDQLQDMNWMDITHPDDLDADLLLFEQYKSGKIDHYSMAKRIIKQDGSNVWVDMHISPYTSNAGKPGDHICIITDITERKKIEETLKYNNEHVMLTGLYNRIVLERTLKIDAFTASAEKRSLVCVNLSGMYVLSLRYGFHYNQNMIKEISDALIAFSSDKCALFSSYENRFVFYIKGYEDKQELFRFSEKVSKTLYILLNAYGISYGIGVIEIDQTNMDDTDDLMKKLLIASEIAVKNANKNMSIRFWGPEMDRLITRENDISHELAEIVSGIKGDRIFLQFQPIWDVSSNKVCTFEALARLKHEKYGLISPDEFISIAEKTNIIVPLGDIIIHQAFRFLKILKENKHETMAVSVNISVIQLLKEGFAEDLINLITESQLNPKNVVVELTESVFVEERKETKNVIDALKASGIKTMIDDFGTGYSSFERQSELAVDCLKIDKIFIDKLLVSKPEDTIIVNMISMAHKLGHYVVAEGVEHDKQLSYLLGCGCDKIQGYLISKPLDEEAALAFLKHDEDMENTKNISAVRNAEFAGVLN